MVVRRAKLVTKVMVETGWSIWLFYWSCHLWIHHGGETGWWVMTQGLCIVLAIFFDGIRVGTWVEQRFMAIMARRGPSRPVPTLFMLWQGGSNAAYLLLVERAKYRSVETTLVGDDPTSTMNPTTAGR